MSERIKPGWVTPKPFQMVTLRAYNATGLDVSPGVCDKILQLQAELLWCLVLLFQTRRFAECYTLLPTGACRRLWPNLKTTPFPLEVFDFQYGLWAPLLADLCSFSVATTVILKVKASPQHQHPCTPSSSIAPYPHLSFDPSWLQGSYMYFFTILYGHAGSTLPSPFRLHHLHFTLPALIYTLFVFRTTSPLIKRHITLW